jgi:four helix bundle protein
MSFIAYEVILDAVRCLPPLVAAIKPHDAHLADQLRRAGQNALLNLAEGRRRTGRDRTNRYRYSAGEAGEAVAALDLALAWQYADADALAACRARFDRALALLWPLVKP